jgi:hypothetical protein
MSEFLSLRFAADEANSFDQHRLRGVAVFEGSIPLLQKHHYQGFPTNVKPAQ